MVVGNCQPDLAQVSFALTSQRRFASTLHSRSQQRSKSTQHRQNDEHKFDGSTVSSPMTAQFEGIGHEKQFPSMEPSLAPNGWHDRHRPCREITFSTTVDCTNRHRPLHHVEGDSALRPCPVGRLVINLAMRQCLHEFSCSVVRDAGIANVQGLQLLQCLEIRHRLVSDVSVAQVQMSASIQ